MVEFLHLQVSGPVLVIHHETKFEHVRRAQAAECANGLDKLADKQWTTQAQKTTKLETYHQVKQQSTRLFGACPFLINGKRILFGRAIDLKCIFR